MVPPAFQKKKPKRMTEDEYKHTGSSLRFVRPGYSQSIQEPWNNFGHSEPVLEGNIDDLFLSNAEIMEDDHFDQQAASTSRRPPKLQQGTTIFNEIGDSTISSVTLRSETRLNSLDDDGMYIGSHLGNVKKRHLNEFKDRVSKRAVEKRIVCTILDEWNSLSGEEQLARKKKAEANTRRVASAVEVIETEEIPPEYLFAQLNLESQTSSPQHPDYFQHFDDDQTPVPPRKRVITYKLASKSRLRDPNYASGSASVASTPPHSSMTSGFSTPESGYSTPGAFRFSGYQNRIGRERRKPRRQPNPSTIPSHHQWHDLGNISHFTVTNSKPSITPLQDLRDGLFISDDVVEDITARLDALSLQCSTDARMVVVKLKPDLSFESESLLARIKGVRLQEIQFHPEDGEAVLIFLYPHEAKAFVQHIECARKASDHEFRRLQIACSWIKGLQIDSIYPAQKNLLELVLSEGATRAIKVDKIPIDIRHDFLKANLKARFPNLIGLRLIRPVKTYEKQTKNSACALLDFSSIIHAVAARAAFENEQVENFEHCTSSYLADPCSQPYDSAAWCTCTHCVNGMNFSSSTKESQARHAEHLDMARNDLEYDFEADAQKPETFSRKNDSSGKPMERALD